MMVRRSTEAVVVVVVGGAVRPKMRGRGDHLRTWTGEGRGGCFYSHLSRFAAECACVSSRSARLCDPRLLLL